MTSKSYEIMIKLLGTFPLIITRRRASIIFSGDFKNENRTNNWFWFLRFELYFGCFYLFTSNILRRIYVKITCTCESLAVSSVYLIHVVWIDGFWNCEKFLLFNEPSLGAMLRGIKAVIVSLFAGLCDRLSGLIFFLGGGGGLIMRGSDLSIQRRKTGQLVGTVDSIALKSQYWIEDCHPNFIHVPLTNLYNIVELFLANSFSLFEKILLINFSRINDLPYA